MSDIHFKHITFQNDTAWLGFDESVYANAFTTSLIFVNMASRHSLQCSAVQLFVGCVYTLFFSSVT